MSNYDFETVLPRRGTDSLKWSPYQDQQTLPFWVADMDFIGCPEVTEAVQKRAEFPNYSYAFVQGSLQEAVQEYLQKQHQYECKKEELVFLPGLVCALAVAARAAGEAGSEVMIQSPVYGPFFQSPRAVEKAIVDAPLAWNKEENSWEMDWEVMEKAVTSQTRMLLLCNPHNPVGRVWSKEDMQLAVDFCRRHELILCVDEIHCDLILEPEMQHHSALQWADDVPLIVLMAPSKTWNIAGLGLSYAVIPDPSLRRKFQQAMAMIVPAPNLFSLVAAEVAYRKGEPWRQELLQVLRKNRAFLQEAVQTRLAPLQMAPCQATYLAWLDTSALSQTCYKQHFEEFGAGLSPSSDFGGKQHLRLNFGCPLSMLQQGVERMERALQQIC